MLRFCQSKDGAIIVYEWVHAHLNFCERVICHRSSYMFILLQPYARSFCLRLCWEIGLFANQTPCWKDLTDRLVNYTSCWKDLTDLRNARLFCWVMLTDKYIRQKDVTYFTGWEDLTGQWNVYQIILLGYFKKLGYLLTIHHIEKIWQIIGVLTTLFCRIMESVWSICQPDAILNRFDRQAVGMPTRLFY